MKLRYCGLLLAVALFSGCGRQEKKEAITLYKVLRQNQANFRSTNASEKEFLDGTKAWAEGVAGNGSGTGALLDRNAAACQEMAQSAVVLSNQLGQVRQAIYDLSLKEEYPQSIRVGLLSQIQKRQKLLQEVRAALQDSAKGFTEFAQAKGYKGDSYPGGIGQLTTMLSGYKGPDDAVAQAITSLQEKYSIKDSDLAG
jgi:hypothetical protein